ncbi:Rho-binding antiterminator [Acidithiobacillus sp. M4-SHS-6]|uniref:Rho-binding antiterminator n=1 Tax=Acidithiobacillus sp. M4-SHS-6 TaxID=3383024 RepID=UPI0039BE919A
MSDHYVPVSCALHSALELAALQHRPVLLHLRDGRRLQGQILDVWTAAGREWLKLQDQQQEHVLDLTFIDHLQESSLHET